MQQDFIHRENEKFSFTSYQVKLRNQCFNTYEKFETWLRDLLNKKNYGLCIKDGIYSFIEVIPENYKDSDKYDDKYTINYYKGFNENSIDRICNIVKEQFINMSINPAYNERRSLYLFNVRDRIVGEFFYTNKVIDNRKYLVKLFEDKINGFGVLSNITYNELLCQCINHLNDMTFLTYESLYYIQNNKSYKPVTIFETYSDKEKDRFKQCKADLKKKYLIHKIKEEDEFNEVENIYKLKCLREYYY